MNELATLIVQIQQGESALYAVVIARFQDMAVGYAYAALGNRAIAEEVAQEAFITAYYTLPTLRDPAAFPGWFRRIVHTQIHRVQRRQEPLLMPLEAATTLPAPMLEPEKLFERQLLQDTVTQAINTLPISQREVITLFYMGDYSQQEISTFLGIPVSTVKMRLYHARQRLKEEILLMLQDTLYQQRPSRHESFAQDVQAMIDLVRTRADQRVADYPSIVDLQELAGLPETQANTRFWEDGAGTVVGFALVDPNYSSIAFESSRATNPVALGVEMLAWGAEQLRHSGATLMRTNCRDDHTERVALLMQQGFTPEVGGVLHFQRALTEPLPLPHLPPGFAIRPVAGEQEVEQLVELHRSAFGTENMTVAYRLAMMRVPEYEPTLDLIVSAPDGQWAAFGMGYIEQATGWLDPIGTRPTFRRQGLARALLLTNLQHFQARGLTIAGTTTSSENLAMQRTAESVGFRMTATTSWYQKKLR